MIKLLIKLVPVILFWGIFVFTVLRIPYPDTIIQANISQLLSFFIPLFLALSLTINLFFKNIFLSASISLGLVSLLILKALDSLNFVTGILIMVTVVLLISSFRKTGRSNLTKFPKIPTLTKLRKKI